MFAVLITTTKTNKMSNLNLTQKETEFLKEMRNSDYYENGIDSILWDYSVNDNLPFKGKVRSGVISSLTQKGLISVYKKEKGDIAGTYSLTDLAKSENEILEIFK